MVLYKKIKNLIRLNGVLGLFNFLVKRLISYLSKKEFLLEFLIRLFSIEFTIGRKNFLNNLETCQDEKFSREIENNRWSVLGSGFVTLETWIKDFNVDLLGNKISKNNYTGNDIKNIWDIARLQYILPQWLLSKQNGNIQAQSKNIIAHFEQFITTTRFGSGPLYSCTMEVAIRAVNISLVYNDIISTQSKNRSRLIENYLTKLYFFIIFNLEFHREFRSNHYLSNLLGLIVISNQLKGGRIFTQFLKATCEIALHEIDRQFYDDGGNFESSSSYHCLSLEMALLILFYTEWDDNEIKHPYIFKLFFPQKIAVNRSLYKKINHKLARAVFLSKYLFKPDHTLWKFGDNDSGYILALNHILIKVNKHHYIDDRKKGSFKEFLLQMGNKNFFIEPGDKKITTQSSLEIDEDLYYVQKSIILNLNKEINFKMGKLFPESGLYIYKDRFTYLGINITKDGQNGNGGHSHLDTGSYEFWSSEKEIIDPGSPCYTGDSSLREIYRGASAHSLPENFERFYERPYLFESSINLSTDYRISEKSITLKIFNREFIFFREWSIIDKSLHIKDYSNELLLYKNNNLSDQITYGLIS